MASEQRASIIYMRKKVREMEKALMLRKKGLSYKEILRQVPVAKSSLSLWLKEFPLTASEKRLLKDRNEQNISRGRIRAAAAHRENRLAREKILFDEARKEFEHFKNDPLFYIGVALYWAEGSKRTSHFQFANSDSDMTVVMLGWIEKFLHVPRKNIKVRLFIHKPYAHEHCEEQWSAAIGVPLENFKKTIFKPTGLLVKKRPQYKGCLRVEITKTAYLRKMQFWQQLLIVQCREYS